MDNWLLVLAFLAGALLPVQAAVNARLGRSLGSAPRAAAVSFLVGLAALTFYLVLLRPGPAPAIAERTPGWAWLGGLIGALYVLTATLVAPRIGVAALTGLAVAGQMAASIALDHFGVFGLPVHPVNWARLTGVALMAAGFLLVRRF
ncbi:MAG TPA: DMT family transporter [Chthonomonadales bacterium]|nr:DMT family transporter [Chthonomonadales bacterium]